MIIQGTNLPIILEWDDINDAPFSDLSVSLRNEIGELKHWTLDDCVVEDDGLHIECPITQDESMNWEEGPCTIEAKWHDAQQNISHMLVHDQIRYWGDKTNL